MPWTDEQLDEMVSAAFAGKAVVCRLCGGEVTVEPLNQLGESKPYAFGFRCNRCGTRRDRTVKKT